jgi:hypothetical protein
LSEIQDGHHRHRKKGLCRAKHDTTTACQEGKVEQVYIKRNLREISKKKLFFIKFYNHPNGLLKGH